MTDSNDKDSIETKEWLDALRSVVRREGVERAAFLLEQLKMQAHHLGVQVPFRATTPYINTIAPHEEALLPHDDNVAKRALALIRWNAMAMVLRATKKAPELGGHIATFASAAVLYDIGFNYFFTAPSEEHGGDLLYIQGHSAPGIYARAFLEGRLSADQLALFRQEIETNGLSSYPHPWLMPDFWQFPTVSMGLGPIQSIYQARFLKYCQNRQLFSTEKRKVWTFCGDGEMDEPESLGAISLAAREKLDNLIWVINCNLQRLDGPVRGNSSVIQELEGVFRGAGWNVIKVIWGRGWDALLAADHDGLLQRRMSEVVDGEYQSYKAHDGAYVREHFFGKYPELKARVAHMSDDEIWALNRGGHDPFKVYAAYAKATRHTGQPTVILAKTVKGYGMGAAGEGQNTTHQQKKMTLDEIKAFRDRFSIPISDADIADLPFYCPPENSPEIKFLKECRAKLGGSLPARRTKYNTELNIPALSAFDALLQDSGDREISTTMAFVRILNILVKDKNIGKRVVPIVPDECRTFGMEGMFRQLGIYSALGQLYTPVDSKQIMFYHEDVKGQILEEGITEAGAFCSWMAAGTSYANNDYPMIPFYIYYSMFGFQRIGDLAWAAGDQRAQGFLLGATAGKTTLAGEGLQHQDGTSHLHASFIPNCVSYDPTFAYELAVIIQDGLRRMYVEKEAIYYYLTVMNENYHQPAMPKGSEAGILKGMYLFSEAKKPQKCHVQLLGSGTILLEVIKAAACLEKEFGISADVWSVTSFNELCREGRMLERAERLNPATKKVLPYVTQCLQDRKGPVIAASDYVRLFTDQIRAFVPRHYVALGTDGYGRSDTRARLRYFFEVDSQFIVIAALKALVDEGQLKAEDVNAAMKKFGLNPKKPNPFTV